VVLILEESMMASMCISHICVFWV